MAQRAAASTYELLRKALPYEIIPTRLPGVYTSPSPPEDLDPNAADTKTLIKYGVLWRRPDELDPPTLRAAWQRVVSRKWKRIIPRMEVQFGKTHQIRGLKKTEAGYQTFNWSGGILQGPSGSFTSAVGTWVIPTVGAPSEPLGYDGRWDFSSWVGIDGWQTTNDVLQAGIQQTVDVHGRASYVAWYQWYVSGATGLEILAFPYIHQVNIPNFSVAPGQTIYCLVQYVNNNTAGLLYLANDTTGEYFSITLTPPTDASFSGSSAEWIMEAPNGGTPASSLPSFNPVQFTPAVACNKSVLANPQNGDYVNIIGFGQQLTSVTLGNDTVTIDFTG